MQSLTDREGRKATEERMRRGEPAPDIERAKVEAELARRILRMWWGPLVYLGFAAVCMLLLLSADDAVSRVLGVSAVLGHLVIAAWRELNRRGAARLLDANRQRWGDV